MITPYEPPQNPQYSGRTDMTLPLIALTMITVGLPDFPQSVADRAEVTTVSVIPAKGERQRRIVHRLSFGAKS